MTALHLFWLRHDNLEIRGTDTEADWSEGRTWVEILYAGTFHHYVARQARGGSARTVKFTGDDLRSMLGTFQKAQGEGYWPGGGPKVDVNHALAMGSVCVEDTQARARIVDLRIGTRSDGSTINLEALFEWTKAGVALVGSGAFAGISGEFIHPDFALSKVSEEPLGGWLVEGATFCNDPMVNDLEPPELPTGDDERLRTARTVVLLSAAQDGIDPDLEDFMPHPLTCSRLSLRAEASDSEIADAVGTVQVDRDTARETLAARDTALTAMRGERDELKTERDELLSTQRTALRDRFVAEGRCTPAKADSILQVLDAEIRASGWAKGVEFVEGLWAKGTVRELGRGTGHDEPGDDTAAHTNLSITREVEVEVAKTMKAQGLPGSTASATLEMRTAAEDLVLARPGRLEAYLSTDSNPVAQA